MTHYASPSFWQLYENLPKHIFQFADAVLGGNGPVPFQGLIDQGLADASRSFRFLLFEKTGDSIT